MGADRIEAFSDGVFAFAFTLLVLDFHAPEQTNHLAAALLGLWPQLLAYTISTLLIGLIWANHRAMFAHLKRTNRMTNFLNVMLLSNVAFLPFPTAVLSRAISSAEGLPIAAFFYGFMLFVGGLFYNALWFYGRRLNPATDEQARIHARSISVRYMIGPTTYLIAALMSFVSPWLSIALYVALIVFFWLPGRAEDLMGRGDEDAAIDRAEQRG
jgi:uncharacterized membrane protein